MIQVSKNPKETKEIAFDFCQNLKDLEGPVIVLLFGDLGAGKTTFVKGVAEFLGVKEDIVSPTFLIQRNYHIEKNTKLKNLIHIDAYRIENENELETIDWEKYSKDKNNLVFIEWPDQMRITIKSNFIVEIKHAGEDLREIKIIKNV